MPPGANLAIAPRQLRRPLRGVEPILRVGCLQPVPKHPPILAVRRIAAAQILYDHGVSARRENSGIIDIALLLLAVRCPVQQRGISPTIRWMIDISTQQHAIAAD